MKGSPTGMMFVCVSPQITLTFFTVINAFRLEEGNQNTVHEWMSAAPLLLISLLGKGWKESLELWKGLW